MGFIGLPLGALFPGNQTDETAVCSLAAEGEGSDGHALAGDFVDVTAGVLNSDNAVLAIQSVAGLIVGIVDVDVAAGGSLVVVGQPGHLLLGGIVPHNGVGSAVGTGNALDLLFVHQPLGKLGAVAGIVVEVLVVVLSPVTIIS